MKKLTSSFLILMSVLVFQGSVLAQSKETRDISGFNEVSFGVSGDLFLKIGSEFRLEIEGDQDVIDDIETIVSGDRLIIRKENWKFSLNDERVTINLTMPSLEGVGVSGSGKVQIMDPVKASDLNLSVSGGGKLYTQRLEVEDLECSISGSGNINLGSEGNIEDGKISISGSGNFNGDQTKIGRLSVSISGSGNCRCSVGESLEAQVSGSGNVTYSGNPRVNAKVSGSGHVRSS